MPTHWNTAIERLDEGKILEDFLPERDKYSYIINKFILSDKSDIRYETKFIADIQFGEILIQGHGTYGSGVVGFRFDNLIHWYVIFVF